MQSDPIGELLADCATREMKYMQSFADMGKKFFAEKRKTGAVQAIVTDWENWALSIEKDGRNNDLIDMITQLKEALNADEHPPLDYSGR